MGCPFVEDDPVAEDLVAEEDRMLWRMKAFLVAGSISDRDLGYLTDVLSSPGR